MLGYLRKSSPWIKLIGILGFICSGLMITGGFFIIVILPFLIYPQYYSAAKSSGFFYIITGIISMFPSLFTYRLGKKIQIYFCNGFDKDLESAFKYNKIFWQFMGIFYIISLSLMLITAVLAYFTFSYTM